MSSLPLWAPDAELDGVEIRVSTRKGGVSQSPYDSLIWLSTWVTTPNASQRIAAG